MTMKFFSHILAKGERKNKNFYRRKYIYLWMMLFRAGIMLENFLGAIDVRDIHVRQGSAHKPLLSITRLVYFALLYEKFKEIAFSAILLPKPLVQE